MRFDDWRQDPHEHGGVLSLAIMDTTQKRIEAKSDADPEADAGAALRRLGLADGVLYRSEPQQR